MLDLTKPITSSLEIYAEENYRDPPFSCVEWSTVKEQGFRVSALTLGTQTGTHIDAPAHFDPSGQCLDALSLDDLIGRFFLLDLAKSADVHGIGSLCSGYQDETILFIRTDEFSVSYISSEALEHLLRLPPVVWVLAGELVVDNKPPLEFHRLIAHSNKYLIENLQMEAARNVEPGGTLIALPLALTGTSGAPCRVVIK